MEKKKTIKCECCGKHPAAYIWDSSYITTDSPVKICRMCADRMINKMTVIKKILNFREIENK